MKMGKQIQFILMSVVTLTLGVNCYADYYNPNLNTSNQPTPYPFTTNPSLPAPNPVVALPPPPAPSQAPQQLLATGSTATQNNPITKNFAATGLSDSSTPTLNPAIAPPPAPPPPPYQQQSLGTATQPPSTVANSLQNLAGYNDTSSPTMTTPLNLPPLTPQPEQIKPLPKSIPLNQSNGETIITQPLTIGYADPSLPTPTMSELAPPPTTVASITGNAPATETATNNANNNGTTSGTNTNKTTNGASSSGSNTTGGGGAAGSGTAGTSSSGQPATPTAKSTTSGDAAKNIQTCTPGSYAITSPIRPILSGNVYNSATANNPPVVTYTVNGMVNGLCSITIIQSAVTPANVSPAGVATNSVSPAATLSKCALNTSNLNTLAQRVQQSSNPYGNPVNPANSYSSQALNSQCNSYFVVNGAAVPYKNYSGAPGLP